MDLNYLADREVGGISNIFVRGALKDRARRFSVEPLTSSVRSSEQRERDQWYFSSMRQFVLSAVPLYLGEDDEKENVRLLGSC